MKVKIISTPEYTPINKFVGGGAPKSNTDTPYSKIVKKNNNVGTNKASETVGGEHWKQYYDSLNAYLKDTDKPTVDIKNHEQYQQALIDYAPVYLKKLIKEGKIPLTNAHRKLFGLGPNATDYSKLTPAQQAKINDADLLKGFKDGIPGHRGIMFEPGTLTPEESQKRKYDPNYTGELYVEGEDVMKNGNPTFNYPKPATPPPPAETKATAAPLKETPVVEQNPPPANNPTDTQKPKYKQQGLPFYQAAPELAGFISGLNTYNYQTPDYTHWEINPPTLNIQSQLQSIDSSQNAINSTTTGNPQVDSARKQAAFTQSLAAKQQAFSNKQNFDAEGRFKADSFNINARTREQNLDTQAWTTIYNDYMPLAKDYAAGERLRAISNLTTKVAKNKANESLKSLYLDNFYQNFQLNGTDINKVADSAIYTNNPYRDPKNPTTTSPPANQLEYEELKRKQSNPSVHKWLDPETSDLESITPTPSTTPQNVIPKGPKHKWLDEEMDNALFMYGGTVKKIRK